ncbi:MAG: methanogenic corrinoid protein MtbC1 [Nonlabens sp.]
MRKEFNTEDTYVQVLRPMLLKIGLLWTKNKMSPAQEHFLSNLVRQKLIAAINALPLPRNEEKKWLLFLPPDEYHEIGLLYAQFLLRKYDNSTLYLGANVPLSDIDAVVATYKPTHVLFFIVKNMTLRNGQKFFDRIEKEMPNTKIMYGGSNPFLDKLIIPERFIRLNDPESFKREYLG